MSKERLVAFTDAVLAIIMTILVLELKKPASVSWSGLWELRDNFFAYTLSFFWLGLLWRNHHNSWHSVKRVGNDTVIATLVMLFFASLFPYITSLVASNFQNQVSQVLYGIVILAVTFSNFAISASLNRNDPKLKFGLLYTVKNQAIYFDIAVKSLGLVISLLFYPPAMSYVVFINMVIMLGFGGKKRDNE